MRILIALLLVMSAQAQIVARHRQVMAAAGPTISYVGGTQTNGAVSGSTTTSSANVTGANICFVAVSGYGQRMTDSPVTVSDSLGNNYTAVPNTDKPGAAQSDVGLWYYKGLTGSSSHTWTVTNQSYSSIAVACFSGAATTGGADVVKYYNGGTPCPSGTTCNTGSITPTTNNQVVISAAASLNASLSSVDSGFAIAQNAPLASSPTREAVAIAYKIQTTAASVSTTWTLSASDAIGTVIASFK